MNSNESTHQEYVSENRRISLQVVRLEITVHSRITEPNRPLLKYLVMETLVVLNNHDQRLTRVHGKYVLVHTRVYDRGTRGW